MDINSSQNVIWRIRHFSGVNGCISETDFVDVTTHCAISTHLMKVVLDLAQQIVVRLEERYEAEECGSYFDAGLFIRIGAGESNNGDGGDHTRSVLDRISHAGTCENEFTGCVSFRSGGSSETSRGKESGVGKGFRERFHRERIADVCRKYDKAGEGSGSRIVAFIDGRSSGEQVDQADA